MFYKKESLIKRVEKKIQYTIEEKKKLGKGNTQN